MPSTSHRDLRVWQLAIDIAAECYAVVKQLPKDELFGPTSQIRRAAASIPANIAEGYGRYSKRETIRFLNIANGSLVELDTHLELARRAGYLSEATVESLLTKGRSLGAQMFAFKAALRRPSNTGPQAPLPRPPSTASNSAP